MCDQWQPFSVKQLRKWWKNSDRSTMRGHSPKSLEKSDNVPNVTGQDFTSAISQVPAFKMQINSKSDVMFTVSTSCSQAHYSPSMFSSFQACIHCCCWTSIKEGETTFMDRESSPITTYTFSDLQSACHTSVALLWTWIPHSSELMSPLCTAGRSCHVLEFLMYWNWPFESIRVKMVLMSSPINPVLCQKRTLAEKASHMRVT